MPTNDAWARAASQRRGFTLVEVLLVLVIMSMVATFVYPSMASVTDSTRANQAAAVISSDLQSFFTQALKRKRPLRLTIDVANRHYRLTDRQSGVQIAERYFTNAAGTQSVNSMTSSATMLDIFPNGLASGSLTITVTVAGRQRQINLTRVGFVRVS